MMVFSRLISTLKPGERVYLPGSAGEPAGLMDALCAPDFPALDITSSFVPGINPVPLEKLPDGTRFTGLFAHAQRPEARARAVFRQLPVSYGAFVKHLGARAAFHACIVHVSPPDADGLCSLGPSVEFTALVAQRAERLLAVINPRLPRLRHGTRLAVSSFAATTEVDAPLREYDVGAPSEQATVIAGHIARLIQDGATLQVGLGKVPDALLRLLTDRKNLKLHSGMLSDGAQILAEKGCLDVDFRHTSCVGLGSQAFYGWLDGRDDFAIAGCDVTHDAARLAAMAGLVAVNSAVSIDLFGQANLEMLDGRMISGVGGAADFARGAALAPQGLSIVALPSIGGREATSRIVPMLDTTVSLPRHDIDVIVTENGAADLRGLTIGERAMRIAALAAPAHRAGLEEAAHTLLQRL